MGDCNVYHCPRLCKYNYASWCPTCDKESPRRRSRSESFEPCRRKGREMKSLTPRRFDRHQEVIRKNKQIRTPCCLLKQNFGVIFVLKPHF